MAGRAEPGSDVVLRDGGTEIGRARADDRGEWVILPDKPLNRGTRELDLDATLPGGAHVKSDDVVMLVVPDDAPEAATATVADRGEAVPPATQEQPWPCWCRVTATVWAGCFSAATRMPPACRKARSAWR
ncbi:hypothetical protein ACFQ4K_25140 [Tistrella bauzanensis]